METLDRFCKFGRNSYFGGHGRALLRAKAVLTKKVTQRSDINTYAEKGKIPSEPPSKAVLICSGNFRRVV